MNSNDPQSARAESGSFAPRVAYFSMEIALESEVHTYSGGLGVLAGDTVRSAADLSVPMVAVTLVHRKGYFRQRLDRAGGQSEEVDSWNLTGHVEPVGPKIAVSIEGRAVQVRAWQRLILGRSGHSVPVYLLDTALPENTPFDQSLSDELYGGDSLYRLCQEVVLGMGGVAMLQALGYAQIENYHMNEGHSSLLVLGLLKRQIEGGDLSKVTQDDIETIRQRCVFTTHTPVPAGHDQFPRDLMRQVLGQEAAGVLDVTHCCPEEALNMTFLALRCSHYINGVAMRHGEISQGMFPRYPISAITNGIHVETWTSPPFQDLFDKHIPAWRHDNLYLRYGMSIPLEEMQAAHLDAKRKLIEQIRQATGTSLDDTAMTLGFARRATAYKRADLLFHSQDRLRWIARNVGPVQVVMGGKAHPRDQGGKDLIRRVFQAAEPLKDIVKVVYVENYDMEWARFICSGVDLWLNTPKRPHEASGTSGMKAAVNGVPSLSVLDGWWIEGHIEGVTGWAIGEDHDGRAGDASDAASLYDKLERVVLPLYYARPRDYAKVMRSAIALNGAFFNTQRMVAQYLSNAYSPGG